MKVKLKTAEQLKEEFGFEYNGSYYETTFNDMYWIIGNSMFEQLGKEIKVEENIGNINYTHYGDDIGYLWHELWFEPVFTPIEFINEVEFEL